MVKEAIVSRMWFRVVFGCGVFCLLATLPGPSQAFELLLGTGERGSFSHFTGRRLCRIITSLPGKDLQCRTVPGASPVHNLTNLSGGALDLTLIDSRLLYEALHETGSFRFLDINYANLSALFPVYDIPVTLLARGDAGIQRLTDVKGKKVNFGPPYSRQHQLFDMILEAKNWNGSDFSLVEKLSNSGSQAAMAFCHGRVQAMIHVGIQPDPVLDHLHRLCDARPVDLADADIQTMVRERPGYFQISLSLGRSSFPEQEIQTFGTKAMLASSSDLDQETVVTILTAIEEQQGVLGQTHPALSNFQLERLEARDWDIPFHNGAERFFRK